MERWENQSSNKDSKTSGNAHSRLKQVKSTLSQNSSQKKQSPDNAFTHTSSIVNQTNGNTNQNFSEGSINSIQRHNTANTNVQNISNLLAKQQLQTNVAGCLHRNRQPMVLNSTSQLSKETVPQGANSSQQDYVQQQPIQASTSYQIDYSTSLQNVPNNNQAQTFDNVMKRDNAQQQQFVAQSDQSDIQRMSISQNNLSQNTQAIYRLLSGYKLQVHAQRMEELGYGEDVYKLALLSHRQRDDLINQLSLMPGHRQKFSDFFKIMDQLYPRSNLKKTIEAAYKQCMKNNQQLGSQEALKQYTSNERPSMVTKKNAPILNPNISSNLQNHLSQTKFSGGMPNNPKTSTNRTSKQSLTQLTSTSNLASNGGIVTSTNINPLSPERQRVSQGSINDLKMTKQSSSSVKKNRLSSRDALMPNHGRDSTTQGSYGKQITRTSLANKFGSIEKQPFRSHSKGKRNESSSSLQKRYNQLDLAAKQAINEAFLLNVRQGRKKTTVNEIIKGYMSKPTEKANAKKAINQIFPPRKFQNPKTKQQSKIYGTQQSQQSSFGLKTIVNAAASQQQQTKDHSLQTIYNKYKGKSNNKTLIERDNLAGTEKVQKRYNQQFSRKPLIPPSSQNQSLKHDIASVQKPANTSQSKNFVSQTAKKPSQGSAQNSTSQETSQNFATKYKIQYETPEKFNGGAQNIPQDQIQQKNGQLGVNKSGSKQSAGRVRSAVTNQSQTNLQKQVQELRQSKNLKESNANIKQSQNTLVTKQNKQRDLSQDAQRGANAAAARYMMCQNLLNNNSQQKNKTTIQQRHSVINTSSQLKKHQDYSTQNPTNRRSRQRRTTAQDTCDSSKVNIGTSQQSSHSIYNKIQQSKSKSKSKSKSRSKDRGQDAKMQQTGGNLRSIQKHAQHHNFQHAQQEGVGSMKEQAKSKNQKSSQSTTSACNLSAINKVNNTAVIGSPKYQTPSESNSLHITSAQNDVTQDTTTIVKPQYNKSVNRTEDLQQNYTNLMNLRQQHNQTTGMVHQDQQNPGGSQSSLTCNSHLLLPDIQQAPGQKEFSAVIQEDNQRQATGQSKFSENYTSDMLEQEQDPVKISWTPLIDKDARKEAMDYGYSFGSKKVSMGPGFLNLRFVCRCLGKAIKKHLDFSRDIYFFLDDLQRAIEDEDMEFSYQFKKELKLSKAEIEELSSKESIGCPDLALDDIKVKHNSEQPEQKRAQVKENLLDIERNLMKKANLRVNSQTIQEQTEDNEIQEDLDRDVSADYFDMEVNDEFEDQQIQKIRREEIRKSVIKKDKERITQFYNQKKQLEKQLQQKDKEIKKLNEVVQLYEKGVIQNQQDNVQIFAISSEHQDSGVGKQTRAENIMQHVDLDPIESHGSQEMSSMNFKTFGNKLPGIHSGTAYSSHTNIPNIADSSQHDSKETKNRDSVGKPPIKKSADKKSNKSYESAYQLENFSREQIKSFLFNQIKMFDERMEFDTMIFNEDAQVITPSEKDIFEYCKYVTINCKMENEIPIICLVYLEKLLTKTGFLLNKWNWKRLTMICLCIGSKVWDDDSLENIHFPKVMPDVTNQMINKLEQTFLEFIDYDLVIKGSQYAKYYFILRTLADDVMKTEQLTEGEVPINKQKQKEIWGEFPLKAPISAEKMLQLQQMGAKAEIYLKERHEREFIEAMGKEVRLDKTL